MQFSSTCPAVSARHNKASRYSKQVNETISRFGAREQGPSRSRQAQAREQEKNEDLLRYLSEIWFPSVPPKYKLFYPVFVAFSSVLAWGSKVRKSKWQLQLFGFFFFSKHSEIVSHVCHSGITCHTGVSLYGIKLQLCDASVRENNRKTTINKKANKKDNQTKPM